MLKKTSKKFISAILAVALTTACFLLACNDDSPPGGASDGKFTISFYSGDYADVVPPITELPGTPIEAPRAPERDGFRFGGWLLNGALYEFTVMPAQNIRLYAKWDEAYTITFDSRGGSAVAPIVEIPGERVRPPDPPPRRPGYRLAGWLLNGEPYYFSIMPAQNLTLTADWAVSIASALPVLNIALQRDDGSTFPLGSVNRENYVKATVGVEGAGGVNPVAAQFRGRGNGSWGTSKKPYRIRFDAKQSLFGWPKSRHYNLISSSHNYADNSMLVAHSAFSLTREVLTDLEYAARTQPVDVYVNNNYIGIYALSERIRVEEGRVDIESEHGVNDTGYLLLYANSGHSSSVPGFAKFSIDGDFRRSPPGVNQSGAGANSFALKSPDPDDVADASKPEATRQKYDDQVRFIKAETQKMTTAMRNFRYNDFKAVADVASFVDSYIIHELYLNDDCGEGGYYIYKKPGGKFYAGPPWDWDRTCSGSGLGIAQGRHQANPFFTYTCSMPEFKADVKARWQAVSPDVKAYIAEVFDGYLDDDELASAFSRNLGQGWKNNATGKKNWLLNRCNDLDGLWESWA